MPARVMETAAFRHDLHGKRLIFNELAPPESRVFALGLTVAELSLRDEMLALVKVHKKDMLEVTHTTLAEQFAREGYVF